MRSGCDPNPLKEVHKEQHIVLIVRNILGSCLTVAALKGIEFDGLGPYFEDLAGNLLTDVKSQPEKTRKQLNDAKERYVFVQLETDFCQS